MPSFTNLCCVLALPARYRFNELLAFHGRDKQALAEYLDSEGRCLYKGLMWKGQPALLALHWHSDQVQACLYASPSAKASSSEEEALDMQALEQMLRRMLGLAYPPALFEATYAQHPQFAPLLARQAGLHVPASPTPFEALSWAIMGQQISVPVAVAMRRRLIALAGAPLAGWVAAVMQEEPAQNFPAELHNMHAYPDAQRVAALDVESLRQSGFSQAKAQTLLTVARAVQAGELPLDEWAQKSAQGQWDDREVAHVFEQLLQIKGIGPWTVNYCLLRGYGWPDGSLHGDVAVRKAIGNLTGQPRPDAATAQAWLESFKPWRALVAAHLWASLADTAY